MLVMHRSMDYMLLLPGRRCLGSEQNLSDMGDLDLMHVYGIHQQHPYLPYLLNLHNPMFQFSEFHEMYGNHQRS